VKFVSHVRTNRPKLWHRWADKKAECSVFSGVGEESQRVICCCDWTVSALSTFLNTLADRKIQLCKRTTTTTVLRPLYRSTCFSRHLQLRTGRFCWCKVLLPACPCWRQPAHWHYGEDAGVLLNSVIYTVSGPIKEMSLIVKDFVPEYLDEENGSGNG